MDGGKALTHVDVYVRSLVPGGCLSRQEAIIERLNDLADSGEISGYTVRIIGHGVPIDTISGQTAAGKYLGRLLSTCLQWADNTGYSFESLIQTRRIRSSILDFDFRVMLFPQVLLVEHVDDNIIFISPSLNEEGTYSISTHLDAIDPDSQVAIPGRSREPAVSYDTTLQTSLAEIGY